MVQKKAEGIFQEMGMDYWLGKTQEVLTSPVTALQCLSSHDRRA